ncbi:MAG: adenylate kinase [Clostridiales Family XIII bacterium]|jgi:adenylate kinase|nr:adenylate kinase [Clostridiales Family XIII bacterium]
MKMIMLGAPGSGKGTQAARIKKHFGVPAISTGDIFRKNIADGTELGKKAKAYMDRGELVPDEIVIAIALNRIEEDDCRDGFLLDGFPRTVEQAEALDKRLADRGQRLRFVLLMEVPDVQLAERVTGRRVCKNCGLSYHVAHMPPAEEGVCDSCGGALHQRNDDREETVKNRIGVYNAQTAPLIGYYETAGILKHLDGTKGPERVFEDIVKVLTI